MPPKKQSKPKGKAPNPASSSKNNKRKAEDDMEDGAEVNGVDAAALDHQGQDQTNRDDWSYDALLRAAVEPMTKKEIEAWKGWCELESEPAFFTTLLSDYGVRNVKIEEIVSMADEDLIYLPQPIFGLVFLHECLDSPPEDTAEDDEGLEELWFANQTVDSACATIALINIIMNCPQIDFGPELQKFKDATKEKSSPLKGQAIGANDFLRNHHNSLVRRIDVLNSDLTLQTNLEKFSADQGRKTPPKKKQKTALKKKKKKSRKAGTNGYHYVAFVEVDGSVWQLDGLQPAPVKIGAVSPDGNVISVARNHIASLIAEYDGSVRFSSMALCQSPRATAITQLAQTVAHLEEMAIRADSDDTLGALLRTSEKPSLSLKDGAGLLKYGLTKQSIAQVIPDKAFLEKVSDARTSSQELHRMYIDLVSEQKMYIGAHRDETSAMNTDRNKYESRKHDALAMINRWVSAIADHGKLEELVTGQIKP